MEQKSLVLILARELADKLATAVFVVDDEGTLVYFDERAAEILGKSFAEAGAMTINEWAEAFEPLSHDDQPLAADDLPLVAALRTRNPAHRSFRIQGAVGASRRIAVTALPLLARSDEVVGAAALFWED